jgi:hypothetical protein
MRKQEGGCGGKPPTKGGRPTLNAARSLPLPRPIEYIGIYVHRVNMYLYFNLTPTIFHSMAMARARRKRLHPITNLKK